MSRRFFIPSCTFGLALVFALGSATLVGAAGYWNMPGNNCQRCGYGYGGGYHAPFILGTIACDGWGAPSEVRLPHAPNPYGCTPCYCGGNYGGCGCRMDEPTAMTPNVDAGPAPQQAPPVAAPRSTLFTAPVQP